ncbi:MAG: hypothetical protein ACLT0Y_06625 [Christensenellales bacterium]
MLLSPVFGVLESVVWSFCPYYRCYPWTGWTDLPDSSSPPVTGSGLGNYRHFDGLVVVACLLSVTSW